MQNEVREIRRTDLIRWAHIQNKYFIELLDTLIVQDYYKPRIWGFTYKKVLLFKTIFLRRFI